MVGTGCRQLKSPDSSMKIVTFRQPGADTRPTFSLETGHLSRRPGSADGHLADPSLVAHHPARRTPRRPSGGFAWFGGGGSMRDLIGAGQIPQFGLSSFGQSIVGSFLACLLAQSRACLGETRSVYSM